MSHPNQRAAHGAVQKAIRAGALPEHPEHCEVCNAVGGLNERPSGLQTRWSVVYHHHSYEPQFWLDVVAVCDSCHIRIHLGQIPEPRTGERRSGDLVRRHGRKQRRAATNPNSIGQQIRRMREAARLTQEQLAERMGGHPQKWVSGREADKTATTVLEFQRIAKVTGHRLEIVVSPEKPCPLFEPPSFRDLEALEASSPVPSEPPRGSPASEGAGVP